MALDTAVLVEAHRVAHRTWQDILSMYEECEIDLENAALITAAYTVASRLNEKALAAVQLDGFATEQAWAGRLS